MSNELFTALIAGSLAGGGGGSTETDDYNNLKNKPKINGTKLEGNLSLSDIGAATSDQGDKADSAVQPEDLGSAAAAAISDFATAAQGDKADNAIQGIKVNSTTVNPDANKVVSITVPTSAADVSALPNTTKYAAALRLTINNSTFVVTGQLIDQDGNDLGTAQTIDLPLESLQTELSANNKLNPAYIDYDSTHAAVTEAQREQIATNETNIGKVQTQANWNTNNGVKNLLKTSFTNGEVRGVIYTLNADDSITVKGTANSYGSTMYIFDGLIPAGNHILSIGNAVGSGNYVTVIYSDDTQTGITGTNTTAQLSNKDIKKIYVYVAANTAIDVTIYPMLTPKTLYDADSTYEPYALPNTKITPELIDLVDSGAKNKLHFTLSELQTWNSTAATGATWSGNVCTTNGIAFTVNSDGTITANGTLISERAIFRIMWNTPNVYGGKILSGCPSGGSPSTYEVNLEQVASPWATIAQDSGNGSTITNNTSTNIYGYIAVMTSVSNLTFKPMICTKAAWDISQKFVPYRPSYEETVEQVAENENNILTRLKYNTANMADNMLDDLASGTITSGNAAAAIAGFSDGGWCTVETIPLNTGTGASERKYQRIFMLTGADGGKMKYRMYTGSWGSWANLI